MLDSEEKNRRTPVPPLKPVGQALVVPVEADSIDGPIVSYGDGPTSINFVTSDAQWGRVTFEKLDSIRVARGEYEPHEVDWKDGDPRSWVYVLAHSPWLRERYEYEKRHYGTNYEFCGDVDEMLRDYSHYVFSFHDQFVEVICAGIWFETAERCIGNREPDSSHPLLDLTTSSVIDRIEGSGIACQVRGNPRKLDDLVRDAALCSQKLLQFAAELDGSASVSWTLDLRVRAGLAQSRLRGYFGNVEKRYEGIATLADVRPDIEGWLRDVAARRRAMGKV
jgi:hypothetical protein